MALFSQSFIDDLRLQADIVQVVQDVVSLKRAGTSYKGLCPFHSEKTPSFTVHREKGFFKCFGCGAGGDVFKFVELHEKVGFGDAVRLLAQRFGVALPDNDEETSGTDSRDREALLKAHEMAARWFREQLCGAAGGRIRQQLQDRGMGDETVERLGLGYAPNSREGLKSALLKQGLPLPLLVRSGLVRSQDDGETIDRFRGRLMIPICRDSGSVIAFGGRATEADQQPKYLNSPETPIYSKSRTLYGLHLTKAAIRKLNYAILVEGYFDFAALLQAGIGPVVASCGTALTTQQGQLLRRFGSKVILSFDPDAAGQGAAVRSCEMLVSEGFDVNVALLPAGQDPDTFVRGKGRGAYLEILRASAPYLDFLMDRAAHELDLATDEGRREFLNRMLAVAARVPDPATRDQFADRLAHRARITEEVVRAEIRKAAGARRTSVSARELPMMEQLKPVERGLIWSLIHDTGQARLALDELEDGDLEGLAGRHVIEQARSLGDISAEALPAALLQRLTEVETREVTGIATAPEAPALSPDDCVRTLKLMRFDRERAALQREIDRLRDDASAETQTRIAELGLQKIELKRRIEALSAS
jgi:DNA primase